MSTLGVYAKERSGAAVKINPVVASPPSVLFSVFAQIQPRMGIGKKIGRCVGSLLNHSVVTPLGSEPAIVDIPKTHK